MLVLIGEPIEEHEHALNISARLPELHVAMVDSLTMARLANTRTDSLKIIIEAGYEFLKTKCLWIWMKTWI